MAAEQDSGSKEFMPSARRLERARDEGDSIRSEEAQAAVAYGALVLACLATGGTILQLAAEAGLVFLQSPQELTLSTAMLSQPVLQMFLPVVITLAPGAGVLVWLIASRGLIVAPSKIAFKLSRVSPVANAKQKFGATGLFDFLRRSIKLLAMGVVLVLFLHHIADDLMLGLHLAPGQLLLLMTGRLMDFLWVVAIVGAFFGLIDVLWQRYQFLQRNRMSRKEMTDEMKESEGDPHLKADRRRRAQEIANRKMLVEVPRSDVIIVNPTHYAIALKWDRKKGSAPVCVAKGVDEIAAKIRELAMEAGVPIHRDPPTARLLHASLELGQQVGPGDYKAVAAAIRFADAIRAKASRANASRAHASGRRR